MLTRTGAALAPLALAFVCSTALAVTPTVTLSPTGNHPQGTTQVSGTGFGANEAVDIYFDATDELIDVTNASGKFGPDTLTIAVSAPPGSHWITAVGRKDGAAAHHTFLVRTRWSELGFNQRGQSRNPYENVIGASNAGNLDVAWTAATGGAIFSSPAVANLTATYNPYVFVGSLDHKVYAFDAAGAVQWTATTGGAVHSSPAIAGNTVYVASDDGNLYAFNAATGATQWSSLTTAGDSVLSSPAVADGIVYVGSNDTKLYAFHASDGTPAWPSPAVTGGQINFSSPTVANGVVYIGSSDHKVYAFDAKTGAAVWSSPFSTGGIIDSRPTVAGGTVFFGSEDRNIYAVSAKTGNLQWSVTTGGLVYSSAAVANGVVYMASFDGNLYALRPNNGAVLWEGAMGGGQTAWSSAAVANGVVYVGSYNDGRIEAFDANGCGAATCSPIWTALTGATVNSSPAISDGVLYVGSYDDNLYAFALDAGDNPAYRFRKSAPPPSYSTLHPDMRLKPVTH